MSKDNILISFIITGFGLWLFDASLWLWVLFGIALCFFIASLVPDQDENTAESVSPELDFDADVEAMADSKSEFDEKAAFRQAFDCFADEVGIPEAVRLSLCQEMQRHINNPREGAKAVERHLDEGWQWDEGLNVLRECEGKRGTFKQQASLFNDTVLRKYHGLRHLNEYGRTSENRPYVQILAVGDNRDHPECSKLHHMVAHGHSEWARKNWPPHRTGCRCTVRTLNQRQLQREGLAVEYE